MWDITVQRIKLMRFTSIHIFEMLVIIIWKCTSVWLQGTPKMRLVSPKESWTQTICCCSPKRVRELIATLIAVFECKLCPILRQKTTSPTIKDQISPSQNQKVPPSRQNGVLVIRHQLASTHLKGSDEANDKANCLIMQLLSGAVMVSLSHYSLTAGWQIPETITAHSEWK